jgi:hypothetical protein
MPLLPLGSFGYRRRVSCPQRSHPAVETSRRLPLKVQTLILAISATLALSVPAMAAASTTTNVFQSPSGNITCRYYSSIQTVACQTRNDHYAVAVSRYGSKSQPVNYAWASPYAFTLAYGGKWTAPGILCVSSRMGMGCRTSTGHGFVLAADAVERW